MSGLTSRQMSVAILVSRGHTDKQIAAELGMAERTVSVHIHRIGETLAVDPTRNVRVQIATRVIQIAA